MPTRPRGCGELALKVSHQGIEVDVLHRECVGVVAVELAAAFGGSDPDPVRSLVAGAGVTADLDEGLDEERLVAVAGVPVVAQTAGDGPKEVRGEVGNPHPGGD